MKYFIIPALFFLNATTNILPLSYQSTLMIHPQSKKHVILYSDMHSDYLEELIDDDELELKKFEKLCKIQKKSLTELAHTFFKLDPKNGSQIVIITETDHDHFNDIVEGDLVGNDNNTLAVLPQMFIQRIVSSETNENKKHAIIIKKAVKPFNSTTTVSFLLNNGIRWIAGDTHRTDKDYSLIFTIYQKLNEIKETLEKKLELSSELKEFSIGNVKEYIKALHDEFEKRHIIDPYYKKVLDIINTVLKTKALSESDHIALLYGYFSQSGQTELQEELLLNLMGFISQKFDTELFDYLETFEKDASLNCLLVMAGGAHNEQLKVLLSSKGYSIVKTTGIDHTRVISLSKQPSLKNLSEILTMLKNNPPSLSIKDFIEE